MPTEIAILIAALGAVSTALSILNSARTAKRTSPQAERWRELDEWKKGINDKLAADKRSLDKHSRAIDDSEGFQRIMLRSVKGILEHLESGNHSEEMRKIVRQIDEFLIER
jgi:hypothetical protein